MQVIGYDPYIKELPGITLYEDIEEVFKRADYISLHIPLTDETKNLVGEKLLSVMKPTAYHHKYVEGRDRGRSRAGGRSLRKTG